MKFFMRYLAELVRVKFYEVPRGTREGENFHDVPRGTREGEIFHDVPRGTRESEMFHDLPRGTREGEVVPRRTFNGKIISDGIYFHHG